MPCQACQFSAQPYAMLPEHGCLWVRPLVLACAQAPYPSPASWHPRKQAYKPTHARKTHNALLCTPRLPLCRWVHSVPRF